MINFIVLGKSGFVVVGVLQAIRGFTDAKCFVVGGEETAPLRWSMLCERQTTLRFDGSDDATFVELVNALVRKIPHVILIPADCDGIRLANRVRDRLQLRITPIPDSATLDMFDNKWCFHQFCVSHALSVPETRYFSSKFELDFDVVASKFGLPFMIKPLNQAGSIGVHIVRSKDYYDKSIRNNKEFCFGPIIAQRYIEGVDIDLSLLSIHGQLSAFAIQQVTGSKINFVPNSYLENVAVELCRAGAYHGVMHVDARIESATGKVFLIESNPRFWGSLPAAVWCGLNFAAESIDQTPRPNGARRLIAGTAYTRHPVIRPSSWLHLIFDTSERGRLLRVMTFDLYLLTDFIRKFPSMFWKYANKQAALRIGRLRQIKG
jgi:predicted ATP-grasp superfamily ATP-dependent carboligase